MYNLIQLLQQFDKIQSFSVIFILLFTSFILYFISMSSPVTKEDIIKKKLEKKSAKGKKDLKTRISDGSLTGKLISLSYDAPFKWFIDNKESSKQAVDIKQKISDAQLYNAFTYRSFTVLKFITAFLSIAFMFILLLALNNAPNLFPALNLTSNSLLETKMIIIVFTAILALYPTLNLSSKAKFVKTQRTKDLPVLQLFLILSLRTGRSIKEIFQTLGNLNTRYKNTFKTAFLVHLRSEKEAFEFLMKEFKDTRFEFTIRALRNMEYYSKEDTIIMLENSLEDLMAESKTKQEKTNLINMLITQGTLILPMLAIGLLILYPIITYVSGMLGSATF